ncbi:MAG: Serine/threonine protein kinase [Labilithrix sp.]|nr:Serine/threonine protein kinase [Labilithrix sp.]
MSSDLPRRMDWVRTDSDVLRTVPRPWMLLRAPIGDETERAHFQRRVVLTLLFVFGFQGALGLVVLGTLVLVLRDREDAMTFQCAGHVVVASLVLIVALIVRRRARSIETLDRLDAFVVPVVGWLTVLFATRPTDAGRPDLIVLLITTYALVLRAAFIPSTAVRTVATAAVTLLPLLPASFLMTRRSGGSGVVMAAYMAIWSASSVICAGVISHVLHGLRARVRDAMRLGQYVLEAKIGRGAMGTVYRASHAMLRRPTAIKLLTESSHEAIARFEREVQLTAGLRHPNTIAIFDYGRTPDGIFYYAMEYLDGLDLQQLVDQGGPQSPSRVVHFLVQICGALEEAHRAGLVHRDIKPSNLMVLPRLGQHDAIKVLDFGLAKVRSGDDAFPPNAICGTPHFIAPEAVLEPSRVDARADLYSLGVTAYFLLTGDFPLDGNDPVDICIAQVNREPKPLSRVKGVPLALERILMACLEKKPERRPSSASELSAQLMACGVQPWPEADARECWKETPRSML